MQSFLSHVISRAEREMATREREAHLGDHVVAEEYGFWRGMRDLARDIASELERGNEARATGLAGAGRYAHMRLDAKERRRAAGLGDHVAAEECGYREGQRRLALEFLRRFHPVPSDAPEGGWGCIGCNGEGVPGEWACMACLAHSEPDPLFDGM